MNNYDIVLSDGEDIFWYLPKKVILPTQIEKYITTTWVPEYTLFKLSYRTYGNAELYWLILAANNIINPWSIKLGDKIKVLLPQYLNEIRFE